VKEAKDSDKIVKHGCR